MPSLNSESPSCEKPRARQKPRIQIQPVGAEGELFAEPCRARLPELMSQDAALYSGSAKGSVGWARELGQVPQRVTFGITAYMHYDDRLEGVVFLDLSGSARKSAVDLEKCPMIFISFEKGWRLEDASLDDCLAMSDALYEQLMSSGSRVSRCRLYHSFQKMAKNGREAREVSDFFVNAPSSLSVDGSSTVWHPSAGVDFSPLVTFSKGYIEEKEAFAGLTPATLHVMTCLGYEQELMNILESQERLLFEDDLTRMHIVEHDLLELKKRELWLRPSRRHYHLNGREEAFRAQGADGFVAVVEIQCKKSGYLERVPVIYLLSENIATYQHFIKSGLFQVRHIKATCEGLAFGGCSRSLLDYISESELGLDTLEVTWLRREAAQHRFQKLSEQWRLEVSQMPLAFSGDLARVYRKEVSHV